MLLRTETPKANPEKLLSLVGQAYEGRVVLPEFQRSFVWSREDIEELLVSILQGYFIGTLLILDTPPQTSLFPFRLVEGLEKVNPNAHPDNYATVRLILDGQQRITSLFYALYEPRIPLRNSTNHYLFYLHLNSLLNGNPDEAVRGISSADSRRLDEMEQMVEKAEAIPFRYFLDKNRSEFYKWLYQKQQIWNDSDKQKIENFHHRFTEFMIPVVSVSPELGLENIVNIFERINRTGVSLSLFDLAAARLYVKEIQLRDLWENFKRKNVDLAKHIKPDFILKIISLWLDKEPRKRSLLDVIDGLDKKDFDKNWQEACEWIEQAYKRLTSTSGYGAFAPKWIPYTTMLIPLAVLLRHIEENGRKEEMYRKLDRWYWGSVFTERYDQAVDTTTYRDVRTIREWLEGGSCPSWLEDFQEKKISFSEVTSQQSSIYRGMMCLIVCVGAKDFVSGQGVDLAECEDDHIFPKSAQSKNPKINSILNRTLISSTSNKKKGDKLPSSYLPLLLDGHGGDDKRLQETLMSHLISEKALKAMRDNDFEAFIKAREESFQSEIERRVRGKP